MFVDWGLGVGTSNKSTPRSLGAAIERMIIKPNIRATRGWKFIPSPVARQDLANLWLDQ
jgi:hypothetical protein